MIVGFARRSVDISRTAVKPFALWIHLHFRHSRRIVNSARAAMFFPSFHATPAVMGVMTFTCSRITRWFYASVIFCAALWPIAASAHQMPYAAILLDFGRDGVSAELILPLQELELGFQQPMLDHPEQVLPKYNLALREYLLAHVHPTTPDGLPWTVEVNGLEVQVKEQPFDLVAHLWMQPPAGASSRQFKLNYDVIVHEVISHKAYVFVRNDWNEARFRPKDQVPPMPEAIGLIRYLVYSVDINRTSGSFWRGFGSVMGLGVQHIAGGLDHLLFLFVLLLPAPLLAAGRRWGGFRGLRPSFVQLLKIITAFTIGHSLTLLIGGMGWVRLPQRPVEILIAVSILVSAIHAIRPIFAGREPWVAGGFGLVHGLAFSASIAEFGFTPWHLAMTILSFNLGIEIMQFAVVLMVIPLLILLGRSQTYAPVRVVGASLAAVAALAWIGARIEFWKKDPGPNPSTAVLTNRSTSA